MKHINQREDRRIHALSTGCFIGHEASIAQVGIPAVELSTHHVDKLPFVLAELRKAGTTIIGIHAPCPHYGRALNPGALAKQWTITKRGLLESGDLAQTVGATYVLAHAFYCENESMPLNDMERMRWLREQNTSSPAMHDYVRSPVYLEAKERTITNLRSLLPQWRRLYPKQRLILENLNPRHGYGAIVFQDVLDIAKALDGEVGICLDVGHLSLSEAALGLSMRDSVALAHDLIVSVHVNQNFRGRYCINRHWDDDDRREGLQDVDIHLPLDVPMWLSSTIPKAEIGVENSAFQNILEGYVQFTPCLGSRVVQGLVDVDTLLELTPPEAHLILEADTRYVPLDVVIASYQRFADSAIASSVRLVCG
jgi:sugar phosphate isomerase/epimerase